MKNYLLCRSIRIPIRGDEIRSSDLIDDILGCLLWTLEVSSYRATLVLWCQINLIVIDQRIRMKKNGTQKCTYTQFSPCFLRYDAIFFLQLFKLKFSNVTRAASSQTGKSGPFYTVFLKKIYTLPSQLKSLKYFHLDTMFYQFFFHKLATKLYLMQI